jgi:RNA polymerase sigma-70 factor (ECF subfamily)
MSTGDSERTVLETAYRAHADYIFRVCLRFAGGDRAWALDRAHDVFVRLHENSKKLDLEEDLRPWLRHVAVNECLLDLRRRDRRSRILKWFGRDLEPHPASPEQELGTRRDVVSLEVALARLPPRERVLLGLMYFDGESLTEAAALVGISKGHASKLHQRAIEALGAQDWEGRR